MGKRDPLILRLSKGNELVLKKFWPDFSQKTAGMSTNQHSSHSLHPIVVLLRHR